MSLAVASAVGCCCGPQNTPCIGCSNAGYGNPVSAIAIALQLLVNGQSAPALFSFTGLYSPIQYQNNTVCRWVDAATKVVEVPTTNGLGFIRWTLNGVVCQPQLHPVTLLKYAIFPFNTGLFNGWAAFNNDGTFAGVSGSFAVITSANLCSSTPQGQYGSIAPPSYQYGVVS